MVNRRKPKQLREVGRGLCVHVCLCVCMGVVVLKREGLITLGSTPRLLDATAFLKTGRPGGATIFPFPPRVFCLLFYWGLALDLNRNVTANGLLKGTFGSLLMGGQAAISCMP